MREIVSGEIAEALLVVAGHLKSHRYGKGALYTDRGLVFVGDIQLPNDPDGSPPEPRTSETDLRADRYPYAATRRDALNSCLRQNK